MDYKLSREQETRREESNILREIEVTYEIRVEETRRREEA
jgi:hypothetical protein